MSDVERMNERCNILEAENATLREELAKREEQARKEEAAKIQPIIGEEKEAKKSSRFSNFASGVSNAAVLAMSVKQLISERYGGGETILKVDSTQQGSSQIDSDDAPVIETTADVETIAQIEEQDTAELEANVAENEAVDANEATCSEKQNDTAVCSSTRFLLSDNVVPIDDDMSAEPDY